MNNIKRGFANLLNFSGRDTAGQFWPYCGIIILGSIVVWVGVTGVFLSHIFSRAQQMSNDSPNITLDLRLPLFAMFIVALFNMFLLASSLTRRLHDCDWRGGWAIIPVVLLITGFVMMGRIFMSSIIAAEPDFSAFVQLFGVNLLYLASLGALIILLCLKGQPHPNRFGDPPTE